MITEHQFARGVFDRADWQKGPYLLMAVRYYQMMQLVVSFPKHHLSCLPDHYSLTFGLFSDFGKGWQFWMFHSSLVFDGVV